MNAKSLEAARLKNLVKKYRWERWLDRSSNAFMISLFSDSIKRQVIRKTGVDAEYSISVYQGGVCYESPIIRKAFVQEVHRYLRRGGSVARVVRRCERLEQAGAKKIRTMNRNPNFDVHNKLKIFKKILSEVNSYVWLTYGLQDILTERLTASAAFKNLGDVQNFIREVSSPSKPTAHMLFERQLAGRRSLRKVWEDFSWLKSRDGFSPGFSLTELRTSRKILNSRKVFQPVNQKIPPQLRSKVREIRQLVYLRSLRGDMRAKFIFLMRPILKTIARTYHLKFEDLEFISIDDLIAGVPRKYSPSTTFVQHRGRMVTYDRFLITPNTSIRGVTVSGTIAYQGIARGRVIIVRSASDLPRVKTGNIFVAQQTFPAYILALRRASAFVTDEGGITCHASIISREMHKPCIVGTKHATKVLKNGDFVEVDAERGIVRKLPLRAKSRTERFGAVKGRVKLLF